jgi:hypothetical protein
MSRWWPLLAGLVTAVLLAVVAFVLVHGPARSAYAGPWPDQTRPGPVLLVPGYGGHKGALNDLAARLRAIGRTAIVVTLPGDGTGDLGTDAEALNTDVNAALATGAASIDLVGYSAGGVVVRLWLGRFRRFDILRRVVTLGSPMHGTSLAALAAVLLAGPDCPTACRQLAPFSDLIRGLKDTPVPARLPWVSIWSRNDTTVIPPDSARLPGAVNIEAQQVCPTETVSHSRLPVDPLVAGMVLAALDGRPWTVAPAPASCATLRALG